MQIGWPSLFHISTRQFVLPTNEDIDEQEEKEDPLQPPKYQKHGGPVDPLKFEQWKQSVLDDSLTKEVALGGSKKLTRLKFTIHDTDCEEKFIKGFGKGG